MHRLIVLCLIVSALLASGDRVRGQTLARHTQARVYGSGSGSSSNPNGVHYDSFINGANSITLGPVSGSGNGNRNTIVTASARSDPQSDRLLKFTATSFSDSSGGFVPRAVSVASSSWRDIVFLNGPGPGPASLRLQFVVDGSLTATANGTGLLSNGTAELGLFFSDINTLQTANQSTSGFPFYARRIVNGLFGDSFQASGFTANNSNPDAFSATFEYDAPYDSSLGGYTWNLVGMARTDSSDGTAAADFGGTLRLEQVFGAGGVSLGSSDISFDSGLAFTPVPEPSGLMLVAGLTTAACWRVRRRRVPS